MVTACSALLDKSKLNNDLSCNWKELQKKLQAEKKGSERVEEKRKASKKEEDTSSRKATSRGKSTAEIEVKERTKGKNQYKGHVHEAPSISTKRKQKEREELQNEKLIQKKLKILSGGVSRAEKNTKEEGKEGGQLEKVSKTLNSPAARKKLMTSASFALWAEDNDIPPADVAKAYGVSLTATNELRDSLTLVSTQALLPGEKIMVNDSTKKEAGRYIAIDCEMVGVGVPGTESERSVLARVSIVNYHGHVLLDSFVKPKEKVTDWRTHVSGVRPSDVTRAKTLEEIQHEVTTLLDGRILVGHAVQNDLEVLLLSHPRRDIRDTSKHSTFRKLSKGRTPALKKLAKEILGVEIQEGEHSSIEDARACMLLYRKFKHEFEQSHALKYPSRIPKEEGAENSVGREKKRKRKRK